MSPMCICYPWGAVRRGRWDLLFSVLASHVTSALVHTCVDSSIKQPWVSLICCKTTSYITVTNCVCLFEPKVCQSCLAPLRCLPAFLKSTVFTAGFCCLCLYMQRGQAGNIIHPSVTGFIAVWQ